MGFALLATLWLLVMITGLAASGVEAARLGLDISRNRLALLQAEWAREACAEIVKSRYQRMFNEGWRYENDRLARGLLEGLTLDSVPLRDGVSCRVIAEDAGDRLNVNVASRQMLLCALNDSATVEMLIRVRRVRTGEALVWLLGARPNDAGRLSQLFGHHGTGQVNVNTAPSQVLACLPGVTEGAARIITTARSGIQGFRSIEEMMQALPVGLREQTELAYSDFSRVAVTTPPLLIITTTGIAGARQVQSVQTILAKAGGMDLVVLWRESE